MEHVFISHASKNFRLADEVRGGLEALSLPCWIAPRNIPLGSSYGEEIAKAISTCAAVLLVLTEDANASKAVANELELAFRNQKVIIPLRVKPIEPTNQLAFFISNSQWVDAFHTPLKLRVVHIAELVRSIAAGNRSSPLPPERRTLLTSIERFLEDVLRYKLIFSICTIVVILAIVSISAFKSSISSRLLDKENSIIQLDSATFGLVTLQERLLTDTGLVNHDQYQLTANFYQNIKDPLKADVKWEAFWFGTDGHKQKISLVGLDEFKAQGVQTVELIVPKSALQLSFCMFALHPTYIKPFTARWDFSLALQDLKNPIPAISRLGPPTLQPSDKVSCEGLTK